MAIAERHRSRGGDLEARRSQSAPLSQRRLPSSMRNGQVSGIAASNAPTKATHAAMIQMAFQPEMPRRRAGSCSTEIMRASLHGAP